MSPFKRLSPDAVPRALEKAERYRLLSEPCEAESIYRDVLAVNPRQREALIGLTLALTDQFQTDFGRVREAQAQANELEDTFDRTYYSGVVAERVGKVKLSRGGPGAEDYANQSIREAMRHYEEADAIRPQGNEDAVLRWNACLRILRRRGLEASDTAPRDPSDAFMTE